MFIGGAQSSGGMGTLEALLGAELAKTMIPKGN